jgi:hypothetical protein
VDPNAHITAHQHSSRHRAEVEDSARCGCFCCLATFPPGAIEDWCDESTTALCPACGIDSVLGDASGYPIVEGFLARMRDHWFGDLPSDGDAERSAVEQQILDESRQAQAACLERVRARVDALDTAGALTPRALLPLMIELFEESEVPGCDRAECGDMLLAQWGNYEFGGPPGFTFDLTRQFFVTAFQDGPIFQLHVTLSYFPSGLASIESDDTWSSDHPTLDAFRAAVEAAPGFRAVADAPPRSYLVELEQV